MFIRAVKVFVVRQGVNKPENRSGVLGTSTADGWELGFKARDPQQTLADTVRYLLSKMPPGHLPGEKGRLEELRKGT